MRKSSRFVLLLVLVVLLAIGWSLTADGGGIRRWLASLHGTR